MGARRRIVVCRSVRNSSSPTGAADGRAGQRPGTVRRRSGHRPLPDGCRRDRADRRRLRCGGRAGFRRLCGRRGTLFARGLWGSCFPYDGPPGTSREQERPLPAESARRGSQVPARAPLPQGPGCRVRVVLWDVGEGLSEDLDDGPDPDGGSELTVRRVCEGAGRGGGRPMLTGDA